VHSLKGSELNACMGANIDNADWQTLDAGSVPTNYQRFADAVRTGVPPKSPFRHAPELQKVLDLAVDADEKRAELRARAAHNDVVRSDRLMGRVRSHALGLALELAVSSWRAAPTRSLK
jgi:hypothetical protein